MKKNSIRLLSIASVCVLLLVSACKKEAGPAGPSGKDGNANVKVFLFTDDTLGSSISISHVLPITKGDADSSLFLFYYTTTANSTSSTNFWYSCPGLGIGGGYQTRPFINANATNVIANIYITNADGSSYTGTTVYLPSVKIVVMKPSAFIVGKKEAVDFSDYKATMKYLGLPE